MRRQLVLLISHRAAVPERHPTTTAAGSLSLKRASSRLSWPISAKSLSRRLYSQQLETFAAAPGMPEIRIVLLRNIRADAHGNSQRHAPRSRRRCFTCLGNTLRGLCAVGSTCRACRDLQWWGDGLIRWIPGRAEVFDDLLEATFDLHRIALYRQLRCPLPALRSEA
jgi:hypothetical protein